MNSRPPFFEDIIKYKRQKFIKNSNDKGFRLLCGYDVMNFYFITDSTAVFDLGIFQGWKTPGKDFKDTIKITNLEEIIQLNKDENSAIIDFKSTTNLSTTIHLEIRYNPKNTDVLNALIYHHLKDLTEDEVLDYRKKFLGKDE